MASGFSGLAVLHFRVRRVGKRKVDVALRWHQGSVVSRVGDTHGLMCTTKIISVFDQHNDF